ncbi:type II 3-dehydroquinate dehydratase [Minwuia sp.]|uniref:type II 3-dehydroquinate dehydratase n=1 Tax=Minwuia sp. TaxID=2493630 RepID=UPI003A8FEA1B
MTDGAAARVCLIQGANMVALGHRQPAFYGRTTAAELDAMLQDAAPRYGLSLDIHYVSREAEAIALIDRIDAGEARGLIMNPAGFLYAGRSLEARLKVMDAPFIEVHITNIEQRGKRSATAAAATGMIAGLGVGSYITALMAMGALLDRSPGRRNGV